MFTFVLVRVADDDVVSPDHNAIRFVLIVDNGIGSTSNDGCGDPWAIAEMSRREHIGSPKEVCKTVDDGLIFSTRPIAHDDGFGSKPLFVIQGSFRNRIQGLIP